MSKVSAIEASCTLANVVVKLTLRLPNFPREGVPTDPSAEGLRTHVRTPARAADTSNEQL